MPGEAKYTMQKNLWKKRLVVGIIILFIGASVVPVISGEISKESFQENTNINRAFPETVMVIYGIGSWLYEFIDVNDTLFFTADNGTYGKELWISDGTGDGTRMVRDINPGSDGSIPLCLAAFNDTLVFSADDDIYGIELWMSDGTANGTHMVKDIKAT